MAKFSLILVCIAAFTLLEVNHALKDGVSMLACIIAYIMFTCDLQIYHYGNGKMWRVFTDGKLEEISRGEWPGTKCLASYNDRLFAVWRSGLYEIREKSFKLFGAGYARASAMVQRGEYLYTTIGSMKYRCARLYRITVESETASMKQWGSVGIYPLDLAVVMNSNGYLIGADENWVLVSTKGDGVTLAPGSATAVTSSPNGYVYAIDSVGDVNIIDASTGRVAMKLTSGGIFTGSRSLVWFRGSLYAIGKDQRFYKINIENGGTTILGTIKTWDVNGRMTAID